MGKPLLSGAAIAAALVAAAPAGATPRQVTGCYWDGGGRIQSGTLVIH